MSFGFIQLEKKDCETKWLKEKQYCRCVKKFPVGLEGGENIEELKFMNLIND